MNELTVYNRYCPNRDGLIHMIEKDGLWHEIAFTPSSVLIETLGYGDYQKFREKTLEPPLNKTPPADAAKTTWLRGY